MYQKEIGPRVQNLLAILGSTINIVDGVCMVILWPLTIMIFILIIVATWETRILRRLLLEFHIATDSIFPSGESR